MSLITSTSALADFCDQARQDGFVAVDTEFIRDRTFWPQLCLVQIADEKQAVAADALADGLDLSPLKDLMSDPGVIKVFHAARQDVEIFLHLFEAIPAPLFDTQVAAMVCGFGESVGFDALALKLAGEHIDKSQRFTDWSRRPLNKAQIEYALADVIHLRPIYRSLRETLENNGRGEWLDEEMAVLTDPATYRTDPRDAWKRIKRRGDNPQRLAVLRELTAWREIEARRRDMPRRHILRDEALLEIAAVKPKTENELARSRNFPSQQAGKPMGQAVLGAVKTALDSPRESWPRAEARTELPKQDKPTVELLKLLLKMTCDTHGVAAKLVASSTDIEAIVLDDEADVPALNGWRRDLFGDDALRVKHGKCAIAINDGALKLIELPG